MKDVLIKGSPCFGYTSHMAEGAKRACVLIRRSSETLIVSLQMLKPLDLM